MAGDKSKTSFWSWGAGKRASPRRVNIRVRDETLLEKTLDLAQSPRVAWGVLILVGFILAGSLMVIWAREQPLVAVGRVMNETRLVRLTMSAENRELTDAAKENARQRTPRTYIADSNYFEELRTSLETLPRALTSATDMAEVDQKLRDQFKLTPAALSALRAETTPEKEPTASWKERVTDFVNYLQLRPLLDERTFQRATNEGLLPTLRLVIDKTEHSVLRSEALSIEDLKLTEAIDSIARDAGFTPGPLRQLVVARVATSPKPTYQFDEAQTTAEQNDAAESVEPRYRINPEGQPIYRRGDVLTAAARDLFIAEQGWFNQNADWWRVWLRRGSLGAAVVAIAGAIAGYTALFSPRIRRNPARIAGAAGILLGTLAIACFTSTANPSMIALTAVVPTVFASVIFAVTYDQRVALAFGALHGVLVCVALDQGIGTFAIIITGVGTAVWNLKEIRGRNDLFRTGLLVGVALAVATALVGFIDRPVNEQVLRETLVDAMLAACGGLVVGGVTLFILPTIENWFDVVTGMTLIELRDSKHPLLRELLQRAPGTYNHSLTVASIAENAADSVGANGLLTYVGALYHDVGKMNKPEYFAENQRGGLNKHDKLSPAMSLLVIVGHVKDGMELAREFGLPRQIQHFVESHHGTTLVEYFFQRAQQKAIDEARREADRTGGGGGGGEEGEVDDALPPDPSYVPDEFEYRYPGPKPRTREAAIVMLADAVESTTRSLAEPTPARIETVVQTLAHRRLLDGQFDECDITLKDLSRITESIAKSVTAFYHGRVMYKSTSDLAKQRVS
ncbi:MAG: HDIG domain-containing protein [Phycisphaerales bacterium]|nr:HDIG domain-containing protein [Phycisphaerales bacterium]